MKEEYYDYSCYQGYKKRWIEKNFPKRFRKHKKKIFEIDITECDEIKNKKRGIESGR